MTTLQDLARIAYRAFETRTRSDGADFVVLRDGTQKWVRDMIYPAHGDMLPDDYRYEFTRDACAIISDADNEDEISERLDSAVSVYTSELLNWLSSSNTRQSYVNDAVDEFGWKDLDTAMKQGQYAEREEVLAAVRDFLDTTLSKINDSEG